jgi:predicted lipoprotein with Yx(FWY)xxD motif
VSNSSFSENTADGNGGVAHSGTWTVSNSSFSGNTATYPFAGQGGNGGVAYNGSWTVVNSTFSGNSASTNGGVAYNGSWTVVNSSFSGNSAPYGGVAFSGPYSGSWTVVNSTFSGNTAIGNEVFGGNGGVANNGSWTVVNSTFSENTADRGGVAMSGTWTVSNSSFSGNTADGGGVAHSGTWTVGNSIFDATNSVQDGFIFRSLSVFKNTTDSSPSPISPRGMNLIQGGLAAINGSSIELGTGYVIDADPLFVDTSDPDGADNIWGTADDGLRLQAGSPTLGQGNINLLPLDTLDVDDDGVTDEPVPLDLAGFLRIQDGSLDLGAYEYGESTEQMFTLTTAAGAGGSVSPAGTQNYSDGSSLTLTATASAGYLFSNWTGTDDELTNPLSVTLNQNRTITATFSADTNDNDGDGLTNYQEIVIYGSNPELEDSSGDELTDKEVVDAGFDPTVSYATITDLVPGMEDADGNGLSDAFEASPNAAALSALSYYYDNDGDGLTDAFEASPNAGSLNSLGFYDESAMIALNLPSPLLSLTGPGNQAELEFTIETSSDLQTWSVSERIQRTLSGGAGKYFVRLQTGAPYVQPTVLIYAHPQYGDILTDANGQVLYYFLYDSAGGNPVVNGSWPLATAAETPVPDVGISATLDNSYYGNVSNGPYLTVDDLPVYTYVGDTEANQASGQGSGAVWYTIRPDGSLNKP